MGDAADELLFRILPSVLLLSNLVFIAFNSEVEQGKRGPNGGVMFGNRFILWSNDKWSGKA